MIRALVLGLTLLPLAAIADESGQLVPRDQCTPLYTVQKRGCVAEHVLRCDTAERVIFRNEYVEDGELTDISFSDADYEYLSEWSADGMAFVLDMIENRDPFSMSNILKHGVDAFDQTALVDLQMVAPREAVVLGDAQLTGVTEIWGGGPVDEVAVRATLDLATMEIWIEGMSYVDRMTGTMFDGAYSMTVAGFTEEVPGEPVKILREGDRGFMMDITLFGCGEEG